MRTKDKSYIENLFKKYKRNKARLMILDKNLVNDDDFILRAIDYSNDKIQTSNLSSLDNIVERREKEKEQLKKDITLTEILLDSLSERDRILIESYYIERKTQTQVAKILGISQVQVSRIEKRILNSMRTKLIQNN